MCSSYGRVLKKILSSRRIRESNWHWGLKAPHQERGLGAAQPLSGVQGQCPVKGPGGEAPRGKTDLRFSHLLKLVLPWLRAILTRDVSVFE